LDYYAYYTVGLVRYRCGRNESRKVAREREPNAAQVACSYYFFATDTDKARCVRDEPAVAVTIINQSALKVARFTERQIQALVANPRVIRNRMKLGEAVQNARALLKCRMSSASSTSTAGAWSTAGRRSIAGGRCVRSRESEAFSKDLKHRGFSFVGPTVVYAYMQAIGMVVDHLVDCYRYRENTAQTRSKCLNTATACPAATPWTQRPTPSGVSLTHQAACQAPRAIAARIRCPSAARSREALESVAEPRARSTLSERS
jgi:hypothetical protein